MKKKLLFEEIMQYNKWVSGIASRELASQRVTLKDLFDKTTDQSPNNAKADKPLPYPLPSVIEQLGDLYINACNSQMLFKQALENPVVKKNETAKEQCHFVLKKLNNIIDELKSIIDAASKPVAKEV